MHFPTSRVRASRSLGFALLALAGAALQASAGAFTARSAQTATLMPDGNVLVAGGVDGSGSYMTSVQLARERQADDYVALPSLSVARASHTATLLPNGEVLVTGGRNGGGVLSSAEVYNPFQNCWHAGVTPSMSVTRFNHTATLLKTGKVLVCGGESQSGAMNGSCELFTPTASAAACGSSPGSFALTSDAMAMPRSNHTSTLLPDGRVFIAGGYCPACASTYIVTIEIYNPATDTFSAAHNLIAQRAYHSATLLGNGKVLIAGGYNGRDDPEDVTDPALGTNKGYLKTTEVCDPASGCVAQASMQERRLSHTATLYPDGSVQIFGGRGNIVNTNFNPSGTLAANSSVAGAFAPTNALSTMNVTGGTLQLPVTVTLAVNASGLIENGSILFSNPQATFLGGSAVFTSGLSANLAGATAACVSLTDCGRVTGTFPVALNSSSGQYFITDQPYSPLQPDQKITGAGIGFLGGPLAQTNSPLTLDGTGTLTPTTAAKVCLPAPLGSLAGTKIKSGTITLTAGTILEPSSFTITLNGASTTIPLDTPVTGNDSACGGGASVSLSSAWTGLSGQIAWSGVDTSQTFTSGVSLPIAPQSFVTIAGAAGTMKFVVDQVDLSGASFTVSIATVVIQSMIFGDREIYNPKTNQWAFGTGATGDHAPPGRFSHSAVLTPSGDIHLFGGLACNGTTCSPQGDGYLLPALSNWQGAGSMSGPRANHTSTLLPNGKILIAGGTSGPDVLSSAELFDPASQTFAPTGSMQSPRDLHSAALLPNGRVLAAGGFTTPNVSTGATAAAEIYYPDTGVWIPTGPMSAPRGNYAAVLLADGNVLVAGGYANGNYLSTAEIYVSTSGIWEPTGSMSVPRGLHNAILLQDGRVLVTGGVNAASGVLATSEIYDPISRAWGHVASFAAGKAAHSHTASLLLDGRVLIAGGNDGLGETNLSQIYDPLNGANGTWTAAGSLNNRRFNHTAILLPNGTVLIAGGALRSGNSLNSFEIFDPFLNAWTQQPANTLAGKKAYHTTVLASNGNLYNFGGYDGSSYLSAADFSYFTFAQAPDLVSVDAPPSLRKSSITAVDLSPFDHGSFVTVTGQNFQGRTEGSGGGAAGSNSSQSQARIVLQAISGSGGSASQGTSGFALDLSTRIYGNNPVWSKTDSSITFQMPLATGPIASAGGNLLPYGWYALRTVSNAQYSDSLLVQAGPPKPVSAPGSPSGAAVSSTTIVWTWPAVSGFDGYNVYSATTGVWLSTITNAGTAISTFTQSGLAPNTTAQITIAAYTLTGDGPSITSPLLFTLSTPPVSVAISSVVNNSLQLSWNANGNAQGTIYEVSESTDNFNLSFSTPVPTLLNLTTTQVVINFLQVNTTYYFRVRAFNGNGAASNFSSIASTATRVAISNLSGTPPQGTTTVIQWNWTSPVTGAGTSFKVYNAATGVVIATTSSTTFLDLGLTTNTPRGIMVSAVTSAGEGPLSPAATAYTLSAAPGTPPLALTNITTGSLVAVWTFNGNPSPSTQYVATLSSGASGTGSLATVTTNNNFAAFSGLTPAAIYSVRVHSVNGSGTSSSSLSLGATAALPNPALNLRILGLTPSSISIAWDANGNDPLAVYQVTDSSTNFTTSVSTPLAFSAASNQTSLVITGLLTSTTYTITVLAQNTNGEVSAPLSLTTAPFNGGVAPGSLGGSVLLGQNNVISGTLADGRSVSLRAPPGAFPSSVFVTISSAAVATPCSNATGIAVGIQPAPAMQPLTPLFFSLSYTDAQIAPYSPNELALMRIDAAGACVPLETSVDTVNKVLTARLNHLSLFQVAAVVPSASPYTATVFPNPFLPSRGNGYVTFSQMPVSSRVRIFTMHGELVFDGNANASGLLTWPGTNRAGRPVASGVYLVSIESGSLKKIVKLAVLR